MGAPASLQHLEQKIVQSFGEIESWLREKFQAVPSLFYCSTDLRYNGYKIASVDTNIFPAGFNNLAPSNYGMASACLDKMVTEVCPSAKTILLIAENHTRNQGYLNNIVTLNHLFEMAGITVLIGRLNGDTQPIIVDERQLPVYAIERQGERLRCNDTLPCSVVLNNDLSSGYPAILQDLSIPIMPLAALGWSQRKKSDHFYQYARITAQFAELLGVDPWLLMPDFFVCPKVNLQKREGLDCLKTAVAESLDLIHRKYQEHHISDKPFVVIKANAGTYGMGVLRIDTAEEVSHFNRKQRNRLSVGKEGVPITDVLIQEGIRTNAKHNDATAEPVVYMVGDRVIGGFYRVNATRSDSDNLNSQGMTFSPIPFEASCAPPLDGQEDSPTARLYVYSVIARLAGLAAAVEQRNLASD